MRELPWSFDTGFYQNTFRTEKDGTGNLLIPAVQKATGASWFNPATNRVECGSASATDRLRFELRRGPVHSVESARAARQRRRRFARRSRAAVVPDAHRPRHRRNGNDVDLRQRRRRAGGTAGRRPRPRRGLRTSPRTRLVLARCAAPDRPVDRPGLGQQRRRATTSTRCTSKRMSRCSPTSPSRRRSRSTSPRAIRTTAPSVSTTNSKVGIEWRPIDGPAGARHVGRRLPRADDRRSVRAEQPELRVLHRSVRFALRRRARQRRVRGRRAAGLPADRAGRRAGGRAEFAIQRAVPVGLEPEPAARAVAAT